MNQLKPTLITLMLTLFILFSSSCAGSWKNYSFVELVEASDLIINGRLIGFSELAFEANGQTNNIKVGVIEIISIVNGQVNGTHTLLAIPPKNNSAYIEHKIGKTGTWFLRNLNEDKNGLFLADHPQRFVGFRKDDPKFP